MPTFEIGLDDGRKLRIEADDQQSALNGAQQWISQNQQQQQAAPSGVQGTLMDALKGVPSAALGRLSSLLSVSGQAAGAEMSQPEITDSTPSPAQTQDILEKNVTG